MTCHHHYLVTQQTVVEDALQHLSRHIGQIHALGPVIVLHDRDVAKNCRVENLPALLLRAPLLAPPTLAHAHQSAHPFECLLLCEDAELVTLLNAEVEVGAVLRLVADLGMRRAKKGDECHDLLIALDAHASECNTDGDVLREHVVIQVETTLLFQHVAATLALCGGTRDICLCVRYSKRAHTTIVPSSLMSRRIRFFDICSCMSRTFSAPRTMK